MEESPNSWHYGSRHLSNGLFNPISTDNNLSSVCYYKPDPVPRLENMYKKSDNNITKTIYNGNNTKLAC